MKYIVKQRPTHGHIRRRKSFLLFPKKILSEWRWLCIAEWYERYRDGHPFERGWRPMYWIDQVDFNNDTYDKE